MNYKILLVTKKTNKKESPREVKLGEVLEKAEISENYPHVVGFFKEFSFGNSDFKPEYLEIKTINTIEEFWEFLSKMDI